MLPTLIRVGLVPFLLSFLFVPFLASPARAASKPNLILIYSDDHGWSDLAAQGVDNDIRTPNLDALARDGVRFARGYVTAPQCVPSRAGVLTGRYQQRYGVDDNLKGPLPLAELTIAERLKPAGYVSGQIGKWHLEPTPRSDEQAPPDNAHAFLPGGQGFDEYWCGPMNTFMASHDLSGTPLANPPQRLTDPRFRCVWQTDAALTFINRHARDPFFLYLAYFTPHVPLQSPEPWFSKTPAHLPLVRRQALAMIAAMDEGIGQIRARLRELSLDRNTLIFFIGDNGAPLRPTAWNGSLNLPLTGEKGMLTDGGVRTPFLAAWPGTLPAGQTYEPIVSALDVAATAVAIAGLPAAPNLDGVNLIPFVRGEKSGAPHDHLFWRWRSQAAVHDGRWKLVLLGPTQRYLFDTAAADGETRNLAAQHPDIAARLLARLQSWDATLQTPGLPTQTNPQDQIFFSTHIDQTLSDQPAAEPKAKGKRKAK
jgi:arylsulfatase A-like enzyme